MQSTLRQIRERLLKSTSMQIALLIAVIFAAVIGLNALKNATSDVPFSAKTGKARIEQITTPDPQR